MKFMFSTSLFERFIMAISEAEPSRDNQPEQAFNFGMMSDDQVVMLGRFIIAGIDREYDQYEGVSLPGDVAGLYVGSMAVLFTQNPDRAKAILKRQALSEDICDEEVAVRCARVVAQHDYELARDILVHAVGSELLDDALGVADDIRSNLGPDQSVEFQQVLRTALSAQGRITPPGLAT